MLNTPNPPNSFVYSEYRQAFVAVGSVLKVYSTRLDNRIVERRELHVTTTPRSEQLKRKFESVIFRLVESTDEKPTDRNGNPIAGGVNSFPEPVHVVLFVTPEAISMLNQRASTAGTGSRFTISICPGMSMLEWDQTEAIPIYESEFHSG